LKKQPIDKGQLFIYNKYKYLQGTAKGVIKISVDNVKIISLINNSPKYDSYLKGCFGVSFWIEAGSDNNKKIILFDVGPLVEPLVYNAKLLGLNLSDIDMIVLSHCHFDHTEALHGVIKEIGHKVPIYAHPDIFRPNFILEPEYMNYAMKDENSKGNIEKLGGNFIFSKTPIEIYPGVHVTGEVNKVTAFEETGGVSCFTIDGEGRTITDRLQDDLSLVINVTGKGLVIITGCGHAGIVNIIKHSIKVTNINRIEGIIGGFHLLEAKQDRVDKTVESIKQFSPHWVAPTHCTGIIPTAKFAFAFGDKFKEINAGDIVEINR